MPMILVSPIVATIRRVRQVWAAVRLRGWAIGLWSTMLKVPLLGKFCHSRNHRHLARIDVMGQNMYVDLSDPGISWQLLTRGCREVEHVNAIRAHVRPGMTGIDIGANIGFFPLIEASLIGRSGRLYCIEPVSANIEILKKNLAENRYLDRAEVFQYLIGAESGKLRIALAKACNSHRVLADHEPNTAGVAFEEVEAISIDDFMDVVGLSPEDVGFLRCDIEGYEAVAIRGMTKLLSASTPMHFFVELHPDAYPAWGTTAEQVVRDFLTCGFRLRSVVKEFRCLYGGEPQVVLLTDPSIEDYLGHQRTWGRGGVQVHLQRG